MKNVAWMMVGLVLFVGCGRGQQKPEAKAPTAAKPPVVVTQPKVTPVTAVKAATPSVAPSAVPAAVTQSGQVRIVAPAASAAADRKPVSIDTFLMPAAGLQADSEAGVAVAKALELYQQGQTNAAVDVLAAAVNGSSFESGRPVLTRKLVALLLASGRLDEAQAACVAFAKDEKAQSGMSPIAPPYHQITQYLIEEKGDAAAAVSWTEQLAALPLSGMAAGVVYRDRLTALCAAGRTDEVIQSVPEILSLTNEVWSASLVQQVASDLIASSDFDNAERFLSAVEASASGRAAYVDTVGSMRQRMQSARETAPGQ